MCRAEGTRAESWAALGGPQMHIIIKHIPRKYGYLPDKQACANELALEQAEVLCKDWARD